MKIRLPNARPARLLLALLLLGLSRPGWSQPRQVEQRQVDLKADFGAVGDGRADDQPAFDRAEAYLQAHPVGVTLRLPAGTYVVGRQTGLKGEDVLHLTGCRRLRIEGAGVARTHLRFRDKLKLGAFDPATGQPLGHGVGSASAPEAASPGYFMWLERCTDVQLRGFDVDGNSGQLVLGGSIGDNGYQVGNDGIFLLSCARVTLDKLRLAYFGRDGLQIKFQPASTFSTPLQNYRLRDCVLEYNGRQGLSWTGGRGLRATNCQFSHTGRGAVHSAPGAGADIEAEDGSKISDGLFEHCQFVDNLGVGLVSDQPELARDIRAMRFVDCLFWGTSAYSLWVRKIGFSFEKSRFFGTIVHGCTAATDAEATQFTDCAFELRPYQGRPAYGKLLVESYQTGLRMRFTRCRFRLDDYSQRFYYLYLLGHPAADFARFRDCDFVFRYRTDPTGNSLSFLVGGVFEGQNRFLDSTRIRRAGPPPARDAAQRLTATSFSPAVVRQGTLRLAGGPDIMHKVENDQTLTIGPSPNDAATLAVAAHNELLIYNSTVRIGARGRLVIEPGGLLRATGGARFFVDGTLEIAAGAYLCLDPRTTLELGPHGRLLVAPGAIRGLDAQRYPGGGPACRELPPAAPAR